MGILIAFFVFLGLSIVGISWGIYQLFNSALESFHLPLPF